MSPKSVIPFHNMSVVRQTLNSAFGPESAEVVLETYDGLMKYGQDFIYSTTRSTLGLPISNDGIWNHLFMMQEVGIQLQSRGQLLFVQYHPWHGYHSYLDECPDIPGALSTWSEINLNAGKDLTIDEFLGGTWPCDILDNQRETLNKAFGIIRRDLEIPSE